MEPLPGVFDMLQYFEKIFSWVESLKMRYILRVVALLPPVTSPEMVAILAAILDFTKN